MPWWVYCVSTGRINRWFILGPLVVSVFLHAFGIILVPSALYLLFAGTRIGETIANFRTPVKAILAAAVVAVAAVAFYYLYQSSYFFQMAFVPLREGEYTLEGYTLLSWNHIVDIFNLLILLFPALPLILLSIWFTRKGNMWRQRDTVFLTLLLLSSLAAVMLLDPKLGMARDWDLFAFAGLVMVLWSFYVVLKSDTVLRNSFRWNSFRWNSFAAAVLAISLGVFSLGARVAGQVDENIALVQAVDYAKLDKKKNMFSLFQMHDYCWKNTDYERSPLYGFDWNGHFPEWGHIQTGLKLKAEGNCEQAMPLFRQAIKEHPGMALAYYGAGSCFLTVGRLDSAVHYLEIADGLNPHDIHTHNDLAHAYLGIGDYDRAKMYFEKAISHDVGNIKAYMNLAEFHSLCGEESKCYELLLEISSRDDAPPEVFKQLGDYYLRHRLLDEAAREYRTALRRGLPRGELESVLQTYPELKL